MKWNTLNNEMKHIIEFYETHLMQWNTFQNAINQSNAMKHIIEGYETHLLHAMSMKHIIGRYDPETKGYEWNFMHCIPA